MFEALGFTRKKSPTKAERVLDVDPLEAAIRRLADAQLRLEAINLELDCFLNENNLKFDDCGAINSFTPYEAERFQILNLRRNEAFKKVQQLMAEYAQVKGAA